MGITADQAILQIQDGMTIAQLRTLMNQVDADPHAATAILYSGGVGPIQPNGKNQFDSASIAKSLSDASGTINGTTDTRTAKTIFDTEVAKFITNPAFEEAMSTAILNNATSANPDPEYIGRDINQILEGKNSAGQIVGNGFWDDASVNLINQHDGDYRIVAPNAPDASTLVLKEIPALMEKASTTGQKVNDIPLQDWQNKYNAEKQIAIAGGMTETDARNKILAELADNVRITSKSDIADLKLGKDSNDILHISTDSTLGKSLGLANQPIPSDVNTVRASGFFESLDAITQAKQLGNIAKYSDLLNKAGTVGDVLGVTIAIALATQEYNAGNKDKAGEIIAGYVGEVAGGFAGGTVIGAGAAATIGILLLIPGVNVGVVAGMALMGAAGIFGGLYGGMQYGAAGEALFKDIYNDISKMGFTPYVEGIYDDYKWATLTLAGGIPDILKGLLPTWLQGAADAYDKGPSGLSPLVLDLNGDGVTVSALAYGTAGSSVYFDMDNDGFAERTAWTTGGDGILAIDRNGNGKIDNQSELFGNTTTYADGFANLKQYDSNNDNKITSSDAEFVNLRVWVDANNDGQTDTGELKTLLSLGISQINLAATALTNTYINSNPVTATSTFVMNGTTKAVSDVWFLNDQRDTHYTGEVTLDVRTLFLPTLKGFGNVKDLHVAMSQDASLLTLVQNFVANWDISKFGTSALNTEVCNILYKWAGVENDQPAIQVAYGMTYSPIMTDSREITFMNKITGNPYTAAEYINLEGQEYYIQHSAFQSLMHAYQAQLILQSGAEDLFSTAPVYHIMTGEFSGGVLSSTAIAGLSSIAASSGHTYEYWKSVISMLSAVKNLEDYSTSDIAVINSAIQTSGISAVWSTFVSDIYDDDVGALVDQSRNYTGMAGDNFSAVHFVGSNGGDGLNGNKGNDFLEGRGGNDTLKGLWGDDLLDGGSGNNTLSGGSGNDIYIHHAGSLDIMAESLTGDSGGFDTIQVKGNYTASQVTFERGRIADGNSIPTESDNLNIFFNGQKNIVVDRFFGTTYGDQRIEKIVFEDGTQIDLTLIPSNIIGTTGNNTLNGADHALLKDDALYGLEGNDTLKGGKGADYINGGTGNDTYLFSLGDGIDTIDDTSGTDSITMAADVVKTSVQFGRINADLIIYYGVSDKITIKNHFYELQNPYPNPGYKIETLTFSDATSINLTTISTFVGTSGNDSMSGTSADNILIGLAGNDSISGLGGNDTFDGGIGDDTLTGSTGNDTFNGGIGNDALSGSTGNDIYLFAVGDGVDTITEGGGTDVIRFSAGVTSSNIRFENKGYGDLTIHYGASDSIKITGHLSSSSYIVESVILDDGTTFNLTGGLTFTGTSGADTVLGTSYNDTLKGLAGDDVLSGSSGDNTFEGGTGNDTLSGSIGADTFLFSIGDGVDTIQEGGGTDVIRFSAGITASNIRFENTGYGDLKIYYGAFDSIKITNHLNASYTSYRVESVILDDGTTFNLTGGLTLTGTSGVDSIIGTSSDDTLKGLAGDDSLHGWGGNDTFDGGIGNDYLAGSVSADTYLFAVGDGTDTIQENGGTDVIRFAAGITAENLRFEVSNADLKIYYGTSDSIKVTNHFNASYSSYKVESIVLNDGTTFNLTGGLTFTGTSGADTIGGTSYNDTLKGLAGNDTLSGSSGDNTYDGGTGNDTLSASNGNDTFLFSIGDGTDTIQENGGTDVIRFAAGITSANLRFEKTGASDLIIYYGTTDSVKIVNHFNASYSSYRVESAVLNDGTTFDLLGGLTFTGTSAADSITGTSFNDTLIGLDGNDVLYGGDGNDTINGGLGDDTINGQAGTDALTYIDATAAVTVSLAITAAQNTIGAGTDTIAGIENLVGSAYNDTLTGDSGVNTIDGMDGNDVIQGGLGDDVLNGNTGIDTVSYSAATAGITIDISSSGGQNTGGAGMDILFNFENILGSAYNDILTGNTAANTLNGGDGNDTIQGGLGNDVLIGGNGVDTVSYAAATSATTVNLSVTNAQNTVSSGTDTISGFENVLGSIYNDVLTGDALANTIDGGNGNDTIQGGLGNDVLIGGGGVDTVSYAAATSATTVNLSVTTAQNTVSSGTDTISGFENILGSAYNDTLTGNSGANTLNGGAGNDTMIGGAGNDIYVVNSVSDIVTEAASGGTDTVQSSETYTLAAEVENLTLTGTAAINATGNGLNNTLTGNSGANNINGGDGNDTIQGGLGNDVLIGGNGVDTVSYAAATSATTVNLSVTTAQNTVSSGTDTISGFENILGSAYNDTLTGNSGANTLNGGAGNDTMIGGAGNDIYVVNSVSDIVTEAASGGTDTVQSSVTYTLAAEVENLTLTGTAAINATGNGLNNTLTGNSGANNINGGDGNDVIQGGLGNDVLIGGNGVDTVSYAAATSATTVNLSVTAAQNTVSSGTDTISGFENILGSGYNDTLTGDALANTIDGGNGNDTIQGGLGNDTLNGGAGIDTVSYASATAAVSVNLSLATAQNTVGAGTDTLSNFEAIFASAFNDTLTGSTAANTINGGAGNDLIVGGLGADILTGGLGADTFQFLSTGLDANFDRISDFGTAQADKIDVKNILVGFDAVTSAITDFIEFTTSGANTVVKVDRDGAGTTYGWQQVAQLDNATGLTDEAALRASGNLIVA